MKKTALFLRSLALVSSVTLASCAINATTNSPADGAWDFKMTSPFGEISANVSLQAAKGELTGTFDLGDGRILPVENGTIVGNQLSFSLKRDGSLMVYEMSGMVEGSGINGTAKAMGAEAPWGMTRKE
jgi:hypothetical protein